MKVIFIINEHGFDTQSSTLLLIINLINRGIEVFYTVTQEVFLKNDNVSCLSYQLTLNNNSKKESYIISDFSITKTGIENLQIFTLVMMRVNPPLNLEFYTLCSLLEIVVKRHNTLIVNHPAALKTLNEKLVIMNFPALIVPTLVSSNYKVMYNFISTHNVCVLKPLYNARSQGIFKLSIEDNNLMSILELVTNHFTTKVMLQKFIVNVEKGEKRIFITNKQVLKNALLCVPAKNSIQTNIIYGGQYSDIILSRQEIALHAPLVKWVCTNKLSHVRIDTIGGYLTEINMTSIGNIDTLFTKKIDIANILIDDILT